MEFADRRNNLSYVHVITANLRFKFALGRFSLAA